MKTKIKDTLLSNLGLKLLSLVVAAVLWFVVVNVENPETRKNFTVNVTFTNEASLAEQNLYYKVNGTGTVKVTLSGKRSIIEKLSTSDISAVADLSRREEGKVPVDISLNRYSGQVTPSSKQLYIAIEVGDMATNRFNVTGQTTGTPSSGHVLNSVSVSPNVITVEGPGEIVSTIDLVTATCNIDGASDDITEAVVPKFYDENGKQVDTSELTINVTTVEVTADIQGAKSVDVNASASGSLPEGLELSGISVDPSNVMIKGEPATLNEISSIEIPDSVIDLSTITGEWTTTVDLSTYLPEGVSLVDSSKAQATLTVRLAGENSVTVQLPTSNLTVRNLADGYSSAFEALEVPLTVSGSPDLIKSLSVENITGYVDATGLKDGSSKLNVVVSLPEGLTASPLTTNLTITKDAVKKEETEKTTSSEKETAETTKQESSSDSENTEKETGTKSESQSRK